MHSVSDLTTFVRRASGDVPPHLVGASSTVSRSKLYVFGGRFNVENRMSNTIYELDLKTWLWVKIEPHPDDHLPAPRYFHSADIWKNHLVVFAGMGYKDDATSFEKEDLCVYDDVRLFDLTSRRWLPSQPNTAARQGMEHVIPGARYAHLSCINGNRLTIVGGQDLQSQWLGDIHVYDLQQRHWVIKIDYPKYCGAYRSIAVSSSRHVVSPANESPESSGFPGAHPQFQLQTAPLQNFKPRGPLVHLPYSEIPEDQDNIETYLYSNYNFTDVKRELVILKPDEEGNLSIDDESTSMGGNSLPPGLRFPTGAKIGNHILIAGTYLAHTHQSFSIWTLDLTTMRWTRLEAGSVLSSGSWCRGCLWEEENKFLVFGNRSGSLVDDYNRRILSWDDIVSIDLEAYGVYPPPTLELDLEAQELGLAALEEELLADFEIICDDGRRIKCNRKVLERRWSWFEQQRRLYLSNVSKALEAIPKTIADVPLPSIPRISEDEDPPPDPRLTPRSFLLSEPYPITKGFLEYLYSTALITSLQHAPAVLSGLLMLATTYRLSHLESLVKHAMHRMLSPQTSVGVYEMATVCDCQNLQIRALKFVMMGNRRGVTNNRTMEGSNRRPGGGGGGGGSGGGGGGSSDINGSIYSRSRGLSDTNSRTDTSDISAAINGSMGVQNYSTSTEEPSSQRQQMSSTSNPQIVRNNLESIPERLDAELLLEALNIHAERRRNRSNTDAVLGATYGNRVKVKPDAPPLLRRGWSSTGDFSSEEQSRRKFGFVPRQHRSVSSLVGSNIPLHSSAGPKRSNSFCEHDTDMDEDEEKEITPTTSVFTLDSPSIVTPVDTVDNHWKEPMIKPDFENCNSNDNPGQVLWHAKSVITRLKMFRLSSPRPGLSRLKTRSIASFHHQ